MKVKTVKYAGLTKRQKEDVHSRMKAPYHGYLYRITKSGKVQYRQRILQT